MSTENPHVGGSIAGVDITGYVRSLRRVHHLCNPGQHAYLTLNTNFPLSVAPGMSAVLHEAVNTTDPFNIAQVLSGDVVKVTRSRPSYDWVIDIDDLYGRVTKYFISERLTSSRADPITTWISRVLNPIPGIGWEYVTPIAGSIDEGMELGLRSAHDALTTLLTYAAAYVYCDNFGVLQIGRVLNQTSGSITQFLEFERAKSGEQTRNVVKVYGKSPIFAKEIRHPAGIDPDLIAAIASPGLGTTTAARDLASFAIGELAPVTDIKTFRTTGSPAWKPATRVMIQYSGGNSGFSYNRKGYITSVESEIGENGYTMEIKVDERCPRIAGWSKKDLILYATTAGNGVYRSLDLGLTWTSLNEGLPVSANVRFIAANSDGEAMCAIGNTLYFRRDAAWQQVTLPTPVNDAGDSPAPPTGSQTVVAIDSSAPGAFHVLVTDVINSLYRTWVFQTDGSILPQTSDWSSVQMRNNQSGFTIRGYDLSARYGTTYVVATTTGS